MMKKMHIVFWGLALLPFVVNAQTNGGQSLDQIFDQMHRQMQKGLPGTADTIRLSPGKSEFYQFGPDSSSYFYFKIDTSFSSGSMPQFFNFDPFGGDQSDNLGDFWGFDQMFKRMEEMQRQMWGMPSIPTEPGDGLLPEERIRQREEQNKTEQPVPVAPPAKPKIKTSRI